jgi:hypothetical protein
MVKIWVRYCKSMDKSIINTYLGQICTDLAIHGLVWKLFWSLIMSHMPRISHASIRGTAAWFICCIFVTPISGAPVPRIDAWIMRGMDFIIHLQSSFQTSLRTANLVKNWERYCITMYKSIIQGYLGQICTDLAVHGLVGKLLQSLIMDTLPRMDHAFIRGTAAWFMCCIFVTPISGAPVPRIDAWSMRGRVSMIRLWSSFPTSPCMARSVQIWPRYPWIILLYIVVQYLTQFFTILAVLRLVWKLL